MLDYDISRWQLFFLVPSLSELSPSFFGTDRLVLDDILTSALETVIAQVSFLGLLGKLQSNRY